jgi:SAM-dependent methyltransferase
MLSHEPPWLPRALQALDVRRGERLLLCLPGSDEIAVAVRSTLGSGGSLTVIEPRRAAADAIARALPDATVALADVQPGFRVGSFDAVLALPFAPPPRDAAVWAAFVAANLRPGGRFVLDLPAPIPMPDVLEAARDARLPCANFLAEHWTGPDADELAKCLRAQGLRRAETLLGTHLVLFASPFEITDVLVAELRLPADQAYELGSSIARRAHATADLELRALRSAVVGMR